MARYRITKLLPEDGGLYFISHGDDLPDYDNFYGSITEAIKAKQRLIQQDKERKCH